VAHKLTLFPQKRKNELLDKIALEIEPDQLRASSPQTLDKAETFQAMERQSARLVVDTGLPRHGPAAHPFQIVLEGAENRQMTGARK
jgi:hypothetical protein